MGLIKKHRAVAFVLGVVLAMATGALAAWVITSGLGGSGASQFGSATQQDAVTFVPGAVQPTDQITGPGGDGSLRVTYTNNTSQTETITGVTSTSFTTSPDATCASHLTFDTAKFLSEVTPFVANDTGNQHYDHTIKADSTLPNSCQNDSVTMTIVGTTSP